MKAPLEHNISIAVRIKINDKIFWASSSGLRLLGQQQNEDYQINLKINHPVNSAWNGNSVIPSVILINLTANVNQSKFILETSTFMVIFQSIKSLSNTQQVENFSLKLKKM